MTILTHSALVAAANGDAVTRAFWDVIAGGAELVAIIRAVRLPASAWAYGRWSKVAAVVVAGWFTITLGALAVPVGAATVIWHTRTLARKMAAPPEVPDLPMADGAAETAEAEQR